MNRLSVILAPAIASVLVIASVTVGAQRSANPPAQPSGATPATALPPRAKAAGLAQPSRPIDLSAETVPAGFVPHDPATVFAALTPPKQDSFESTRQYQARIGTPDPTTTWVFTLEPTVGRNVPMLSALGSLTYDADREELSIPLHTDPRHEGYSADMKKAAILLKRVTTGTRRVKGSNAFGASQMIDEVTTSEYNLYISSKDTYTGSVTLRVPMSPDTARDAIANIRVLVVAGGASDGPTVTTGHFEGHATLENPTARIRHYYNINVPVKSVWIYNKKTGVVYQKLDDPFQSAPRS